MTDHFVATKLVFSGKKYINDEITNDNGSQQHLKNSSCSCGNFLIFIVRGGTTLSTSLSPSPTSCTGMSIRLSPCSSLFWYLCLSNIFINMTVSIPPMTKHAITWYREDAIDRSVKELSKPDDGISFSGKRISQRALAANNGPRNVKPRWRSHGMRKQITLQLKSVNKLCVK